MGWRKPEYVGPPGFGRPQQCRRWYTWKNQGLRHRQHPPADLPLDGNRFVPSSNGHTLEVTVVADAATG